MPDAYGTFTVSHRYCGDNYWHTKPPQAKKLCLFFPSTNYRLFDGVINMMVPLERSECWWVGWRLGPVGRDEEVLLKAPKSSRCHSAAPDLHETPLKVGWSGGPTSNGSVQHACP